jgi:putative type II/III system pilus formation protein
VVIGNPDVIDILPGGDRDLIIQAKLAGGGTNIQLLDGEGIEIANVIVKALPSWQRFNDGKGSGLQQKRQSGGLHELPVRADMRADRR